MCIWTSPQWAFKFSQDFYLSTGVASVTNHPIKMYLSDKWLIGEEAIGCNKRTRKETVLGLKKNIGDGLTSKH